MRAFRHPHHPVEYTLLEDGTVLVVDLEAKQQGIFGLGGRWLSGALRQADAHYLRYVYDCSERVSAISPTLRDDPARR